MKTGLKVAMSMFWMFACIFFVSSQGIAASYQCKEYPNRKGTVDGLFVNLGTIIYTDGKGGWKTYVKWPGKFDVPSLRTTWSKNNVHTPSGSIILKFKAKLAGTRKFGIWRSRKNVITVKLINESNGQVVAQKTISKKVGKPKTYTFTLPQYGMDKPDGSETPFRVEISFNKKDGAGGDDGTCSYYFTGVADAP